MKDLNDDKKDKEDKDKSISPPCSPIQGKELMIANLAHVPCRFFKQGACTAGDSCPFSHSMPERKSAQS